MTKMGRPKGSKNKTEVIKMKAEELKNKNAIIEADDAKVNVVIDLRVTKSDIYLYYETEKLKPKLLKQSKDD